MKSSAAFLLLLYSFSAFAPPSPEQQVCDRNYGAIIGMTISTALMATIMGYGIYDSYFSPEGPEPTEKQIHQTREQIRRAKAGENDHKIPVDLKNCKHHPTIVLYPERHDCEQCEALMNANRGEAEAGGAMLLEEGTMSETDGAGLEDAPSRMLGVALLNLNAYQDYFFSDERGVSFLSDLTSSPQFSKEMWESAKKQLKEKMQDKAADQVGQLDELFGIVETAFTIKGTKARRDYLLKNKEKVGKLGAVLPPLLLPQILDKQRPATIERYPGIQKLKGLKSLSGLKDPEQQQALMNVILDVRNDDFSSRVLSHYQKEGCAQAGEIRVRVGALHLPGVYHQLRTSLDVTPEGKKVIIHVDERHLGFRKIKRMRGYALRKETVEEINRYESERLIPPPGN